MSAHHRTTSHTRRRALAALGAAAILLGLAAGSASAGQNWPNSIVGTWNATANQSPLTITITSQSSTGRCHAVAGSFFDVTSRTTQPLAGFYCSNTGRYHLLRNDPATNDTYQDFSGNVSDLGSKLYMGGIFADVGGSIFSGEYSFFASK